ncbi:hypothetical protein [Paenibacillus agaridevorans]|uniref:hypothetical protein n=1 Tax=Paenibacillus agaridevorans TaxID=171404 RepID=UPI001BE4C5B0|nr:hypothetical protein [Paenibacillus agaridevorans]
MRLKMLYFIVAIVMLIGCSNDNDMYDSMMKSGIEAMSDGEYDKAIIFFEESLNSRPDDKAALEKIDATNKLIENEKSKSVNMDSGEVRVTQSPSPMASPTIAPIDLNTIYEKSDGFYVEGFKLGMTLDEVVGLIGEGERRENITSDTTGKKLPLSYEWEISGRFLTMFFDENDRSVSIVVSNYDPQTIAKSFANITDMVQGSNDGYFRKNKFGTLLTMNVGEDSSYNFVNLSTIEFYSEYYAVEDADIGESDGSTMERDMNFSTEYDIEIISSEISILGYTVNLKIKNNTDKLQSLYVRNFVLIKVGEQSVRINEFTQGFIGSMGYYELNSAELLPGDVGQVNLVFTTDRDGYELGYIDGNDVIKLSTLPKKVK